MSVQDKLIASAQKVVGPEEQVTHVVAVQSFYPPLVFLALFGVLPAFLLLYISTFIWGSPYRLIAVTPTRVLLLKAQRTSYRKATSIEYTATRAPLGPVVGGKIQVQGKNRWVIAGGKKVVAAADAELAARPA